VSKADFPEFSGAELPQDRARRRGAERLRAAVAELPLRYAPFFDRLAGLWELPEAQVRSELERAKDPSQWQSQMLPGVRVFDVARARDSDPDLQARLMRFEPGARFPRHRHRGAEQLLVLEGAYADGSGLTVHAGQQQSMIEGSEHELRIIGSVPCVAAVSEHGIAFTGPLLRWVNALLR